MGRPQLLTQFGGRECASRSETFSAYQRKPSLSLRRDRCAQISRHRHSKWRSTSGDASGVDRCRKPACFVSQETLAYLRSVRLLSMHGYGRRAPRIAEICKLSCIRSKKLNSPSGHFFLYRLYLFGFRVQAWFSVPALWAARISASNRNPLAIIFASPRSAVTVLLHHGQQA